MRNLVPILATLSLGALMLFLIFRAEPQPPNAKETETPVETTKPEPPARITPLSLLAENPDWTELEPYQQSISRTEFEHLLTEIFTTDETWRKYISIHENHAEIAKSSDPTNPPFILEFASGQHTTTPPRNWKTTASRSATPQGKPLTGLHIAIDPGHIGGEWAKVEGRWFQIGNGKPVTEGDMTLKVAKILQPRLEKLGAKITLVRSKPEPITSFRPSDFGEIAKKTVENDPESLRKFTEKLFYRTAEIRARANLVNHKIQPDLVLCLHFNAEAWGDPENPTLVPRTHFHILLNGAYTTDEVRLADQRFAMLKKLLQRTHEEEALVGKTIAHTFAEISNLPPYTYFSGGNNFRTIPSSPFLYARNLLANRLYDCPVIFMEPYVMNSTIDYARIQAGDYQGLREINGKNIPSIFQEYADALTQGLIRHYEN
ncbi:MAG: N-acetylmuramoyl-L-alanine amidase [Akkermansiaceae bacterium]